MEVPKDRLATTDTAGDRVTLYPAEVRGFFRRHRNWTQAVLIFVFFVLPWIKINGHQALLLNIPERRFAFFGLTLWAHDGPLIFFVLAILTFGLAFVTAVWGRVWCGWACPQTVFIDGVFRRIEFWIEGSHLERRKLDAEDFSFRRMFKKTIKWFSFTIVSLIIAHSFAAYFVGAEHLAEMSTKPPAENWTTFLIVFFIAGVVLFDFGWFREQFCIIMCPYGRFQSVLMSSKSLAVMYDEKRGEPRKGSEEAKASGQAGDCVACGRCVAVCPTGIDIRRGIQMECINCTACIDACDEIMEKVNKPKGLIRYSSLDRMAGLTHKLMGARSYIYLTIILIAAVVLIVRLAGRADTHLMMLRAQGAPYRLLEGEKAGRVMNQFKAHIQNQTGERLSLKFEIADPALPIQLIEQVKEFQLIPGELGNHFMFIEFPKEFLEGKGRKTVELKLYSKNPNQSEPHVTSTNVELLGP